MPDEPVPVKVVHGIAIHMTKDGRFRAAFGQTAMTRSRLREIEVAIANWASSTPTTALAIRPDVPTKKRTRSSYQDGAYQTIAEEYDTGFHTVTITGYRDGQFRTGVHRRDVLHFEPQVHDPELQERLADIASRCQDAVAGYQREWSDARATAKKLTPEHLSGPSEPPR